MTNDYHIGEEIQKEMRRQGMKPGDFAHALNRERQTVYDIFKKRHIATDTLAEICRVLNRDFFSELSRVNFSNPEPADQEDIRIKEQISALVPEHELNVFSRGYRFDEVIEEFLLNERTKPLVIFYTAGVFERPGRDLAALLDRTAKRLSREYNLPDASAADIVGPESGEIDCHAEGCMIRMTLSGTNYPAAIKCAEEVSQNSRGRVILIIPVNNTLTAGRAGGLNYDDIADELFAAWKEHAHFAYLISPDAISRRELYHAYQRTGIIDRLIDSLSKNDEVGELLYNLVFDGSALDVEQIKAEDSTGLSRIRLFYRGSNKLSAAMKKLMHENGVNNHPRLSMWLDIRNGHLVDFQYNPLTQPSESKI